MNKMQENDIHLIDKSVRESISTELDKTMMVEAGAGSGKTTSLVNRMVALIGERKTTIEKISAVTFTRKAAAELRERFQIELEKSFQGSVNEKKERFGRALADLEQVFTGTIHSFCARLLRERPVEAGVDPAFEEMDEIEDKIHQDTVWREYPIKLLYEGGDAVAILHDLGVNSKELREIYHKLVLYPEVKVVTREIPVPDIKMAQEELKNFMLYAVKKLPKDIPEKGWDNVQSAIRNANRMMSALNLDEPRDFFRIMELFDKKSLTVTQNRWPSRAVAKEVEAQLNVFKEKVVLPALKQWREYRHFHLMKVVKPAAELCRERRREMSKLNFQDLLMNASQLLRDNPEVRAYFKKRFSHILIDEFQDTDPIQAEVMLYLTGSDLDETDWHKLRPEQGSLFIVGDPKQSIYRFRRADIDTYNLVKEIIKESGGLIVELKSNFRSMQSIAEWLNPIFGERFPDEGSRYQAPFGELQAVRKDTPKSMSGIKKITIPKKGRNKAEEIVEDDALCIASWIRYALDGNIKIERTEGEKTLGSTEQPAPSDFLILLRTKKMIPEYAKKLEEFGIPFEVSGGNAFKTASGLREVIKILKAIAEPDSTVDLVSALRGLFFGISDDMLYRFKRGSGRFSFYSSIPEEIDKDVRNVFQNAYDRLKKYKEWSRLLPPSVAIEKIIEDVGLIPYLLSDEMGGSQTGNILKVIEFLQHSDIKGDADFISVVEELESLLAEGEMDEIDIAHGSLKAVRIMNLHKAKGLEAPIVFLANPSGKSDHPVQFHIQRQGEDAIGYFAIVHTKNYQPNFLGIPPDWDTFEQEEKKYDDAEEDRLLYVASTRAKNLLVISNYPEKADINYWSLFDGYLDKVEELMTPLTSLPRTTEKIVIKKRDFDRAEETLIKNMDRIGEQTYAVENVTSLTKGTDELPVWRRTGRGLKWGNVIHRTLEAVSRGVKGGELDLFILNVLNEEGRPLEEKTTVLSLIEEIVRSDFWKEVESAKEKYVEVPFSLRVKPIDLKLSPSTAEWVILSGTIDLVYKSDGGWTIVDYKTDDVRENLKGFVDYYSPQVKAYSRFWEEMSGEKVVKAGLYFTQTKEFVPVAI
jgi:ATP-dependent helicase/nuclease subunit A